MRRMPITAVTAVAAALVLGLSACATAAPAETTPVESSAPAPALPEADLSMFGDIIQDFPEADTAALTALSERLDPMVPSVYQVDVQVSIFTPGTVTVRFVTVDEESIPTPEELLAVLRELDAFTGTEVTHWTVDAMAVSGAWVEVGPSALLAGIPEEFVDGFGDIEISPADLRAALS